MPSAKGVKNVPWAAKPPTGSSFCGWVVGCGSPTDLVLQKQPRGNDETTLLTLPQAPLSIKHTTPQIALSEMCLSILP